MKFTTLLCGSASLLAVATSAFAQQAATDTSTAAAPQAAQEIVVTGSRIVRNGYAAPTPVTVATAAELQATTPSNIPDGLNKLPAFSGSTNSAGTTNAVGGSGGGTPSVFGGNFLNLRDMGAIRTLVLMDGRRVPPTALNGQVDTNALPEMLVQRVDVVTGGASAVYGSDAVTGVVNFILDKNFNGLKAFGQVGNSTVGDARSYRFGLAAGTSLLGDRLHIEGSFEQSQNNGIDSHLNRGWAANIPDYVGTGTVANPFTLITNARQNNASLGGLATSGPFSGQQFTNSGLAAFNKGTPTASATINSGGDGAYNTNLPLVTPLNTVQAFARADYDLTSNVKAYLQVSDSESKVWNSYNSNAPATAASIFSGNPFLPAAAQAQLTAAGATNFTFSRLNRDLAAQSTLNQLSDAFNITAGLTGKTFGDFTWDAYYTHGTSIVRNTTTNNINYANYYAALDAVTGPNGAPVCRVSTTASASLYPGCAPINMFGTGNQSAQALAFIYQNTQWQGVTSLDDFAGSLSGNAFEDWAGPVSVAANVEYRSQSLAITSNANPLATQPNIVYRTVATAQGPFQIPASYVGLTPEATGVNIPTTTYGYATTVQSPQHGSNSVWEVSGETVIPLLKDMPFAKSLDATGAVRYTDYSSTGSAVTWKAGFNYQPINDLRIRFTESRDIRAPTLYDLYAGTGVTQLAVNDPLTGRTGVVTQITGGNPNLVPEVSNTTTVGFVYSPSWVPRFRMSVDYYNINMTNAISSINGSNSQILAQCDASGGTSPLCSSIVRPLGPTNTTTANFPTYVTNYSANLAQVYTHGIDFEASYNFMLDEVVKNAPGQFNLRALYSYQPVLNTVNNPGAPTIQLAGVAGMSADRVTTTVDYRIGPFSVDWEMRWLSSQNLSGTPLLVYAAPALPAIFYHDINLTYRFQAQGHAGQVFLVVDNVFNQAPRISPSTSFSSIPGFGSPTVTGDDVVGRYFTLGFRAQY